MKRSVYWVRYVTIFLLVSCATSNVTNDEPVESMPISPLDGIWTGEFDIRGKGPYDFTAIHLNDRAYAYSLKAKAMCIGALTFDGEHSFHKYVLFVLDGGPFDWASITGTLEKNEEGQNLLVSHFKTLNGGDTGALNVTYNEIYDQPSSLEKTYGEWSYTDREGLSTDITIDENGKLLGSDTDGCEYSGFIDIINPNYNVYKINVDIKECSSVSGLYEGVSFLSGGVLNMQIANSQYALYFAFE